MPCPDYVTILRIMHAMPTLRHHREYVPRSLAEIMHTCNQLGIEPKTTRFTCQQCGTIRKSGKPSCCAHGGSWFGKCGSAVDEQVSYSWSQGLRVCNAQPRSDEVVDALLIAEQPLGTDSSRDEANATISKLDISVAKAFAPELAPIPVPSGHSTALASASVSRRTPTWHNASLATRKTTTVPDKDIHSASVDTPIPEMIANANTSLTSTTRVDSKRNATMVTAADKSDSAPTVMAPRCKQLLSAAVCTCLLLGAIY